jgi:uncharacterized protein (DUF169 family)
MSGTPDVQALLGLQYPPIAIGLSDSPPDGVPAWSGGPVPSGCTFWNRAQQGEAFYTRAEDHYNCAIGAYTHNVLLPADRAAELPQTLEFLVSNNYVAMEELPGIPTLAKPPKFIAYAPVDSAGFPADVIVVAAKPAQAMLVYEACLKAHAAGSLMNTLGRPGCAIIPLALNSGSASLSLGCKGNRTYTGLPDGEMYVCVPGPKWEAVANQVAAIVKSNEAVGAYHADRKQQFQTA